MFASATAHKFAHSKSVMVPVVLVFMPCHWLRSIHAVKTQSIKIGSRDALSILHNSLIVFTATKTSLFLGLERELVKPVKDFVHRGFLVGTLERPDVDCPERFLVAKQSFLFAIALRLEQILIGTEQFVEDDCSKPSFCGVELF